MSFIELSEILGNWGEFIGSIAVVVTLIYLAIQVRQNTTTVKSSTHLVNTKNWNDIFLTYAEKDNVAAWSYGYTLDEQVDPSTLIQFQLQCRVLFLNFENQFYQYKNGTLDEETYQGYTRAISTQVLAYPGFRVYWDLNKSVFGSDFVEHMSLLVAKTPEKEGSFLLKQWFQKVDEHKLLSDQTT